MDPENPTSNSTSFSKPFPSSPSSPALSPEESALRAKNIEAVKQLLRPEEWAEVKRAAYLEELAGQSAASETALAEALEALAQVKTSIGRLYGHFHATMVKWGIVPRNSWGHEISLTGVSEEGESKPKKTKAFYRFDQDQQELIPISELPIPSLAETLETLATESRSAKRRKKSSLEIEEIAKKKAEIARRRELMERQLQLRPSTIGEIMARLKAEGFPVDSPYQAQPMKGNIPRVQTLVAADIYLLLRNGIIRREEGNRFSWVAAKPDRYTDHHRNRLKRERSAAAQAKNA